MIKHITVAAIVALLVSGVVAWAVVGHPAPKPAPAQTLAGLAGPDIPSPYLRWGGVAEYKASQSMHTATTTLCAIESPVATSTLVRAQWTIRTGTSTAATIDLATSTTAFATTTNLVAAHSVASGAQSTVSWASSGTNGVLAPNTWVTVMTAGAGLGGYTYGGTCDAVFEVI